jgi:hypothetical protein
LEQKPKAFANYAMVVGNEDFRGGGHGRASEVVIGRLGDFLELEERDGKYIVFFVLERESQRCSFLFFACCQLALVLLF